MKSNVLHSCYVIFLARWQEKLDIDQSWEYIITKCMTYYVSEVARSSRIPVKKVSDPLITLTIKIYCYYHHHYYDYYHYHYYCYFFYYYYIIIITIVQEWGIVKSCCTCYE